MRMWMVSPSLLCDQHLLGEHNELHKHRWTFVKKHRKDGYIKNNCIEPESMAARHEELVAEMKSRGFNHRSPYEQPDISYLPDEHRRYRVDTESSLEELYRRCEKCRGKS